MISKSLLKSEDADKVTLNFVPQTFVLGTSQQALEYIERRKQGSDFILSQEVSAQIGVDKIEKGTEDQRVEEKALEKLKEIQEAAYKEAFGLGLEEGRTQAFEKNQKEIEKRMSELDQTLTLFKNMKSEMLSSNEAHFMKLLYHMCSRVVLREVKTNPEILIEILRQSVQLAQDEENVKVQVPKIQFDFIEELKKKSGREYEFLKKLNFEGNEELSPGSCIVETNYGQVDSRIEERLGQLWTVIEENSPQVKEKLESEGS